MSTMLLFVYLAVAVVFWASLYARILPRTKGTKAGPVSLGIVTGVVAIGWPIVAVYRVGSVVFGGF